MLLRAVDSTLLIVDMQQRLQPAILQGAASAAAAHKLAQGARLLDVPVVATEHHQAALGPTIAPLGELMQSVFHKRHFSAAREPGFEAWLPSERRTIVVVGWETHVCVLQTIAGLSELGFNVVLVTDATGSRRASDHDAAVRRLAATRTVTTEMVLFEWMETSEHARFRELLQLVKQSV